MMWQPPSHTKPHPQGTESGGEAESQQNPAYGLVLCESKAPMRHCDSSTPVSKDHGEKLYNASDHSWKENLDMTICHPVKSLPDKNSNPLQPICEPQSHQLQELLGFSDHGKNLTTVQFEQGMERMTPHTDNIDY